MKNKNFLIYGLFLISVLLIFAGCGGGGSGTTMWWLSPNDENTTNTTPTINTTNIVSLQISIDKEFMTDYIGTSASPSYTNDKNTASQAQVFTYMNAANNSIITPSSEIINMDLGIVTVTGPFKGTNLLIKVPQKTQQTSLDNKDAEILMGTIPQTVQTTLKTVVPIDYKSNIATSIIKQDYNGYQDVIFDASQQMSNKIVEKTDAINVLGVSNTQIKAANTQDNFLQLKFEIANAEDKMPFIDLVSPRSLELYNTASTVFNIFGKNFGNLKDKIKIEIEGKSYSVLECSDKLIKFPLPLELMLTTKKFSIVLIKFDDNNNSIRKTIDNAFEIITTTITPVNNASLAPPFSTQQKLIVALQSIASGIDSNGKELKLDDMKKQILELFPPEKTMSLIKNSNQKRPRDIYQELFNADNEYFKNIMLSLSQALKQKNIETNNKFKSNEYQLGSAVYQYDEIPIEISDETNGKIHTLHIKLIRINGFNYPDSWYIQSL
ncbi:MAG: hypothetical protein ACD_59C00070G0003 [uncultured bacterium]|nr:MAG: hypothetical protein ACD_59C00070G0003 [uncultured bacterium]